MRRILPALIVMAAVACEGLIGLERLPPLELLPDASLDGSSDAAADGAAASSCATAAGSYLCDDFDDPNEPFGARWRGAPGIPNPVVLGNADGGRVSPALPSSPPHAFEVVATRTEPRTGPVYALFHLVDKGTVDAAAVELQADVRLLESVATTADAGDAGDDAGDAGDDADAGEAGPPTPRPRLVILSVGGQAGTKSQGAQLVLSSGHLSIVAGSIVVNPTQNESLADETRLGTFDVLALSRFAWLRVAVAVGKRDTVDRRAKEVTGVDAACPPSLAVAAAWSVLPPGNVACIAVPDELASLKDLPVLSVAGLFLVDLGSARVLLDNIRLDPIR